MESRTKHRILGVLVIIGLIIILLPLFQSNNEVTSKTKLVQTPPFPDQPLQISQDDTIANQHLSNNEGSTQNLIDINSAPGPDPDDGMINTALPDEEAVKPVLPSQAAAVSETSSANMNNSNSTVPIADQKKSIELSSKSPVTPINPAPDSGLNSNKISPHHPEINTITAISTPKPRVSHEIIHSKAAEKQLASKKAAVSKQQKFKIIKMSELKQNKPVISKTSVEKLIHLKNSAWVIQVGSFKNKINATRTVNQLRAKGYQAFLQEMSTSNGEEQTRVFVGPESQRKSALNLVNKIYQDVKLQGIVISYRPLSL